MGLFLCIGKGKNKIEKSPQTQFHRNADEEDHNIPSSIEKLESNPSHESFKEDGGSSHTDMHAFMFSELAAATNNFSADCLLWYSDFGKIYKGQLDNTSQVVAVKQLDNYGLQGNRDFLYRYDSHGNREFVGLQGNREFLAEKVLTLSSLHHSNLENLIGYCAEGDQILLVYEYMSLGALEDHLYDLLPDRKPLDWNTRLKIAAGVAKGLEYLHDKANPPVIHGDLQCLNILLDEGYSPKLSDFGLAKNDSTLFMQSRSYGYYAPEYLIAGIRNQKSDVYSFGVVLLEIITGRKAIDSSRVAGEVNLVSWARPLCIDRKFSMMVDPLLQGQYPTRSLYQALCVAALCVAEQPNMWPLIAHVATALAYLVTKLEKNPE